MKIRYNVNDGFGYVVTFDEAHEKVDEYKQVVLYSDYELNKFVMILKTVKTDDDFTKTTDSDIVSYYDTITEAMEAFKAVMLWHNIKIHA